MTQLFIRLSDYFRSHRAICWLSMVALFVFFGYFAMQIHLEEVLQLDSINLVDLVALVQYTYKITIPAEDLPKMKTFNDLYDYIEQHLEK